jgi:hypothetical protein
MEWQEYSKGIRAQVLHASNSIPPASTPARPVTKAKLTPALKSKDGEAPFPLNGMNVALGDAPPFTAVRFLPLGCKTQGQSQYERVEW